MLYRLQPDLRDRAVGYVTDLSERLTGRTLEVCMVCGIDTTNVYVDDNIIVQVDYILSV